jgi:hypothetical protein
LANTRKRMAAPANANETLSIPEMPLSPHKIRDTTVEHSEKEKMFSLSVLRQSANLPTRPDCSSTDSMLRRKKLVFESPRLEQDDGDIFPSSQGTATQWHNADERYRYISQQAGTQIQNDVWQVPPRLLQHSDPQVLQRGMPQHVASRIRTLYLCAPNSAIPNDSLLTWLDTVQTVFVNLDHLHVGQASDAAIKEDSEMLNVDATNLDNEERMRRSSLTTKQRSQLRRLYILCHMPCLKSIDGVSVTFTERVLSRPAGAPRSELSIKSLETSNELNLNMSLFDGQDELDEEQDTPFLKEQGIEASLSGVKSQVGCSPTSLGLNFKKNVLDNLDRESLLDRMEYASLSTNVVACEWSAACGTLSLLRRFNVATADSKKKSKLKLAFRNHSSKTSGTGPTADSEERSHDPTAGADTPFIKQLSTSSCPELVATDSEAKGSLMPHLLTGNISGKIHLRPRDRSFSAELPQRTSTDDPDNTIKLGRPVQVAVFETMTTSPNPSPPMLAGHNTQASPRCLESSSKVESLSPIKPTLSLLEKGMQNCNSQLNGGQIAKVDLPHHDATPHRSFEASTEMHLSMHLNATMNIEVKKVNASSPTRQTKSSNVTTCSLPKAPTSPNPESFRVFRKTSPSLSKQTAASTNDIELELEEYKQSVLPPPPPSPKRQVSQHNMETIESAITLTRVQSLPLALDRRKMPPNRGDLPPPCPGKRRILVAPSQTCRSLRRKEPRQVRLDAWTTSIIVESDEEDDSSDEEVDDSSEDEEGRPATQNVTRRRAVEIQ